MKYLLLLLIIPFHSFTFAQSTLDSKRQARNTLVWNLFNSGGEGIHYFGMVNSIENQGFGIGPEYKAYLSAWGVRLVSFSGYCNYKYIFSKSLNTNAFTLGGHFGVFGLESNLHINKNERVWSLAPKIGYDIGNLSLFYGYNFKLAGTKISNSKKHQISFKYFLYLDAFKYHRMRKKNHYYK